MNTKGHVPKKSHPWKKFGALPLSRKKLGLADAEDHLRDVISYNTKRKKMGLAYKLAGKEKQLK